MSARTPTSAGIDRLRGLANVGAAGAAAVLTEALDLPILASPPRVRRGAPGAAPDPGGVAVLFQATGPVSGTIGLFLTRAACDAVLQSLLGAEGAIDPRGEDEGSALCELGNIVASQTVSAIANVLGVRILLSVPKLVTDDLDAALAGMHPGERGVCFESDLEDGQGALRTCLVFALAPA